MHVERLRSPNFEPGRDGAEPIAVVLHTTDGTFSSAVDWFGRAESRVSAHYLVALDGGVLQLVNESDTAFHAGRLHAPNSELLRGHDPNRVTIGIEFADDGDPAAVHRPDAQYCAGAEVLRAVCDRWGIPLDRTHVLGHRELNARKTCPGNLDLDRLLAEAGNLATERAAPRSLRSRLVVLLPARNAAADLPGWLTSVRRFADAVVALDDGSTDDTSELLAAEPLVELLLHNPRRDSYAGWNDAANRQRLLDAAADLDPDWILFLDADERIDPTDADALRAFLDTDALPGLAYGFRHLRMWGDRYDPSLCWVYRLFAFSPAQRLPEERLHFNPIPCTIPPPAFVRTTLRLQHLGAVDEQRRRARLAKYREADPDGRWRTDFGGLHTRPERTERWIPRPIDEPVLVTAGRDDEPQGP